MAAPRKSKKTQEAKSFEVHELVPYACHFNARTVVSKNVELIQFIKVTTPAGLNDDEFRETVRSVLNEYVDPTKIAVWIHTLRTNKKLVETGKENFVKHVDLLWKMILPDELRYENTLYISLVIDFKKFPLWQPQNFLRSLSSRSEIKRFDNVITVREAELTELADNIISSLKKFGASRLEVVNRGGVYYSEQMEFFHKLLTFIDITIPVELGDISKTLYRENFNFNLYTGQITMTKPGEPETYYGSVITLKESTQMTANALKDILNSGYELVVSESLDLAFGNKFLSEYKYQKYVNGLTEDKKFVEIMGGREVDPVAEDFGLSQLSIMILNKGQANFKQNLADINRKLEELGIVCFVEDVHLERSFWAILPGNFSFLKRQHLVPHTELASFASLGIDKFTAVADCMFGEPVTFFETQDKAAFSLHFLNSGQSNILITGATEPERQLLCNLITAQAAKFGIDIIFYDATGKYENFAKSVNAHYMRDLNLEEIKQKVTPKSLIIINSLKHLVGEGTNLDPVYEFIDHVAGENGTIMTLAEFSDDCEALLPNFPSQVFMHGDVDKYADHFDLFEDEIKIIDLLEPDHFYFKHGYEELILTFHPSDKLARELAQGSVH